jgi:hypothetical protein
MIDATLSLSRPIWDGRQFGSTIGSRQGYSRIDFVYRLIQG